ncbi:MAG: winged helix DNA-binding domain-containing protein [Actinobacteria bacterium HGW-Actinobacteria-4]|nr:MAG: winged helix DNA-binding domain-containing protein [Actinobacteria bacterium HGW-Actinobacteria-4]
MAARVSAPGGSVRSVILTGAHVRALRMQALLLNGGSQPRSVASIVDWFGAMQAQDVASGHWSLGVRMPGSTEAEVLAALERKEALRTWPMRGTVHLVPARDAAWMVRILGARPLADGVKRRAYLGLEEAEALRAVDVLRGALEGGNRLTRAECVEALNAAGVATASQLAYHLLWFASQLGVTAIAPHVGKEQTFVLLDDWVPDPHTPERDEALGWIALRYFRSHGPASVKDFARWTALTMADARAGIAVAGAALALVETEAGPMLASAEVLGEELGAAAAGLDGELWTLPGFDEYLLGYGDRSLFVTPEQMEAVIPGKNGVFQATIVQDGRVAGIWKRTLKPKVVAAHATDLVGMNTRERMAVEAAFDSFAHFVGRPVEVRWN